MQLILFNIFDDISPSDGSATFGHIKEGAALNEKYECQCIYEMLTAKELFDVVIKQESVEIEPDRVHQFCKRI